MPTKAQQKQAANALAAFHKLYATTWGEERWGNSLRPALLAPTRYAAVVNTFAHHDDSLELAQMLEGEQMIIPCLQGRHNTFPQPQPSGNGLLTHYNMDAASVLAVHVLDVQANHSVLDLCAAPGGKSVAIAQRKPEVLHSNELDNARNRRLTTNLKSYLPQDFNLKVLRVDGTNKTASFPLREYDRVLVDAPCSSERHIIHAHAKNPIAEEIINWKPSHSRTLANTQVALLMNALRLVKDGGKIVYATCSISTAENDSVIARCLEQVKKLEYQIDIEDDEWLDRMSIRTTHGRIVLPDHPSGGRWGPLYFCVLIKKS